MQITKQEIRNIRKELGLTIRETARILDCTEKTVYNKENPANEPADLVWYYAMRWVGHEMNSPIVLPDNIQYKSGEYHSIGSTPT